MKPPWAPVDPGPGFHHVIRWDKVVHIVRLPLPSMVKADKNGNVIGESVSVTMVCGRKAKVHAFGVNRFTTQPATCLVCVAGGYK